MIFTPTVHAEGARLVGVASGHGGTLEHQEAACSTSERQ